MKDYENMTDQALLHNFCSRVPDLYMDMLFVAQKVGDRASIIRLLLSMDEDEREGRRGPIRRPPWTPD